MSLRSELEFTSFLQYSPKGSSEVSRKSRIIRDAVKNDREWPVKSTGASIKAVEQIAHWIKDAFAAYPVLRLILGPDTTLIPIPRSAPLKPGSLWPSYQICEALVKVGLGAEVVCALKRMQAVQKSAFAPQGARPGPLQHYESTRIDPGASVIFNRKITLVDDFVTRGATFLGMEPHLAQKFPTRSIACFALIRTMSGVEVETLRAPVRGIIAFNQGHLHREP